MPTGKLCRAAQYFRGTFQGYSVYDALYLNKKPKYTIKYIR